MLIHKYVLLIGYEIFITSSNLRNVLADCSGSFESYGICDFLQAITVIAHLQNLCVLLRQLAFELLNVDFRNHLGFKLATGICNLVKLLAVDVGAVLHQVLDGNMLGGAAMVPGLHEILIITVLTGIVVDLAAVPDFINHWLPVLFLYDFVSQVTHEVAEVLVAEL